MTDSQCSINIFNLTELIFLRRVDKAKLFCVSNPPAEHSYTPRQVKCLLIEADQFLSALLLDDYQQSFSLKSHLVKRFAAEKGLTGSVNETIVLGSSILISLEIFANFFFVVSCHQFLISLQLRLKFKAL